MQWAENYLASNAQLCYVLKMSHPVELWVWIPLSHPLVLTDLLHAQSSTGLQNQHVSDQVLTVCSQTQTWVFHVHSYKGLLNLKLG